MKKISIYAAIAIVLSMMASCGGGESSTPLGQLCDVYAELAENKLEVANAFGDVYRASGAEQQSLQEIAVSLSKEMDNKNEALANKAAELGAQLQGTEIPCEVSSDLGFTVDKAFFATVNAQPNLANIVIEANVSGDANKTQYILMIDGHGDILNRMMGTCSENTIRINFRITTDKGPNTARNYGAVRSLRIVSEAEYKGQKTESDVDSSEAVNTGGDNEEITEAAFTGENETSNTAESVTVNGVTISKGANLVETLKKFKNITWDYNADFGVTATVENVWLVIEETDLTQAGQDIINAIPSDMENNIKFSIEYIKPSAKVGQFEAQ